MADAGILVAWGKPVPGRERMAAALFEEAVEMWTKLERAGEIESFETVSLEPHGDLNDFFLLRGDRDQLARLRVSEEFMQLGDRANMVLWNLRIVGARVGEGAWGKIQEFEAAAQKFG
jgi:hypothetical protein